MTNIYTAPEIINAKKVKEYTDKTVNFLHELDFLSKKTKANLNIETLQALEDKNIELINFLFANLLKETI